jgi:hypothetical protein
MGGDVVIAMEGAVREFESQLSRRNCQAFSTGFSSGERGGSGRSVMLSGKKPVREVPAGLVEDEHGMGAPGRLRIMAEVEALRSSQVRQLGALRKQGPGTLHALHALHVVPRLPEVDPLLEVHPKLSRRAEHAR